jgi:phage tail-like protein
MTNLAFEMVELPYTAFRFEIVLILDNPPAGVTNPVCNAAFAECDGLEMTMEPKAVREGGNNQEQIHLIGPVSYGQLTLKRGMTANLHLWNWFVAAGQTGLRSTAQGQVTLWDTAGNPSITFILKDCLPVKLRGPSLNAKDGQIAIEEMQLVYSSLSVRLAGVAGAGFRLEASTRVSGGPGLSSSSARLDIG